MQSDNSFLAASSSPAVISALTTALGEAGINIDNMLNKSKKDYAYTMLDVSGDVSDAVIEKIKAVDTVIRVRVIK